MWNEFKKFAFKGNVVDLAVGVVIGAAFGKIVSSLVKDIITPLLGMVLGGVDFTSLHFGYGKSAVMYGNFIQTIFDFLIIAASIFMFVKVFNKLTSKKRRRKRGRNSRTNKRRRTSWRNSRLTKTAKLF